jgi:very-short-patch-repair endonuclease
MDWQDLARTQASVISRRQLTDSGLSAAAIRGLLQRRDLIRLLPGVYSPRVVPTSFAQRVWAAALWSGGTVSHRSAARLWELPVPASSTVHVIVDRPVHRRAPNVRLHRVPLAAQSIITLDGLPVTNRAVTVIELLRSENLRTARDLLDRALQRSWVDLDAVGQARRDGVGRAGNAQLRDLLDGVEPGAHARSEAALHRILRRAGVTGWEPQHRVRLPTGVAYLDLAFPDQRLVLEVDGKLFHDRLSDAFESDRARQNELILAGWRVLRFTWRMVNDDPDGVADRIRRALAATP